MDHTNIPVTVAKKNGTVLYRGTCYVGQYEENVIKIDEALFDLEPLIVVLRGDIQRFRRKFIGEIQTSDTSGGFIGGTWIKAI